jgi:hypothetical protein
MSAIELREVIVPAYLEAELVERERVLAKRCERMGVPAPVVEITRRFIEKRTDELGREFVTPRIAYVVHGERPALSGGWQVVASVEHFPTGNIVSVAPYARAYAPTDLLHAPATCDHCGHNRARKFTIVIRDEAGVSHRVGKACLRDFTGHNLPAVWEIFDTDLSEWSDDDFVRHGSIYSLTEIVALSFAAIEVHGWRGATDADGNPSVGITTRKRVESALRPIDGDDVIATTGEHYARAVSAIEWISATTDTEGYLANLRAVVLAGVTDSKRMGLLVSLARSYGNHLDHVARNAERERERADEVRVPCPIGRVTVIGKVVSVDSKDTDYGTRHVMTVRDDTGFTVWGSQPSSLYPSVGDRIEFTASVERSDRDECFGFYKRPTKARLLVP